MHYNYQPMSPPSFRIPMTTGSDIWPGGEPWKNSRLLLALAAATAAASVTAPSAQAGILPFRKKTKPPPPVVNKEIDEFVSKTVAIYWPILQNLGFSGAAGYATAYALKVRARNPGRAGRVIRSLFTSRPDLLVVLSVLKLSCYVHCMQVVGQGLALVCGVLFAIFQVSR